LEFHPTSATEIHHEAALVGCHRCDGGERFCMGSIIDGDWLGRRHFQIGIELDGDLGAGRLGDDHHQQ
jgi:hypothetical protein